jgi:hypothetical protein
LTIATPWDGFTEFDVGDVGEQDHPPAFLGRPLADLQPTPVLQAIQHRLVRLAAGFFAEQTVGGHQALDLGKTHPRDDPHPTVGPERLETAVEQDDPLLFVKQHECIGNALDRIDQVPMGRLRPQPRFPQQMVAGLEFGHGLVQRIGTLTHLLGQHHRMLEGCVRVVATSHAGFHPLDQRVVDAPQLVVFVLQGGELRLQLSDGRGRDGGQWQLR